MSTGLSVLSIGIGAAFGANLRWLLGLAMNAWFPRLPMGTLAANLLGAFLIGMAIALFSAWPGLSQYWRLFFITGFLGALTTFSTFSAEIFTHLQTGALSWALLGILAHVLGSLAMVALGMAAFMLLHRV